MSDRLKKFLETDVKNKDGFHEVFDQACNNIDTEGQVERVLSQCNMKPNL